MKMQHIRKVLPTEPLQREKIFGSPCVYYDCQHHCWIETTDGNTTTLTGICRCQDKTAHRNDQRCKQYVQKQPFNPEILKKEVSIDNVD